MSTWISNLSKLALAALLSGCVAAGTGGTGGSAKAPARISVLGGTIIVGGPRGYCVDADASSARSEAAFVLLGSCASLAGSRLMFTPKQPAVLTASVLQGGASITASFGALGAFFQTEAGRAALSRSGRAEDVTVHEAFASGDAFYVHLSDVSQTTDASASVEPEYWRALFDLNGKIVTLSALSPTKRPLPIEAKRAALDAFLTQMKAMNPPIAPVVATAEPAAKPEG